MPKIKAGTVSDYDASMAEAIEKAFEKEWKKVKNSELPGMGREDRQILFVAIAQGVVSYLKEHAEGVFRIHSIQVIQDSSRIRCSGQITTNQGTYPVTVRQNLSQNNENDVKSTGNGKVEILTTGELYS